METPETPQDPGTEQEPGGGDVGGGDEGGGDGGDGGGESSEGGLGE